MYCTQEAESMYFPASYESLTESNFYSQETTSKVRTGVMTIVTEGAWPEAKL
jgi:hypothetical protein